MADVMDIRPGIDAERLIDPPYIDARIDQLLRETEAVGVPVVVVVYYDGQPQIRLNWHAADQPHTMCGVMDEAKDFLRGVFTLSETDEEEDVK